MTKKEKEAMQILASSAFLRKYISPHQLVLASEQLGLGLRSTLKRIIDMVKAGQNSYGAPVAIALAKTEAGAE